MTCTSPFCSRTRLSAFAHSLLAASAMVTLALAPPARAERRESGSLVFDGIPSDTGAVLEGLRKFQNSRSATLQGWTAEGAILMRTRFGDTAQLHRVKLPGGMREQLTFFSEPVRNAKSSPAGDRYIFAKDVGGAELYQGYLVDRAGGQQLITDPGTRNDAFVFSRDGKRIAWTRATSGRADWDIVLMDGEDLKTRRVVAHGPGVIAPLDFSPDGRRLLLHRYISATASERYLLDLDSGKLQQINPSAEEISYVGGRFSPDGKSILVLSDQNSDFTRLVRFDLASGRMSLLSPASLKWDVEGYDLTKLSAFDLSPDGRLLAYSINEDGRSRLIVTDLVSGRPVPVPDLGNIVLRKLLFSPDGTKIAMTISAGDAESDIWTWDIERKALTRWTYSETGGLSPGQLPTTSIMRFRSFDGLSIPAIVYRAKAPRPGRRPVLIVVHGGPEAQMRPAFDGTFAYFVDKLGAVVIAPNIRGSTGYGRAFTNLDNGAKREDSVRDIGALLDWIGTQPDLDPSRVVIYGASYGGYVSLAALALYNDRLAGAIDEVGISNWASFLKNTEGYRRDSRRAEYGDERDPAMAALFEKISPLKMTARMTKPLLVIQGANDPRVPRSEAEQIVAKLRADGREVWYLLAKNEGHGFRKKANQDAAAAVQASFLMRAFGLSKRPD
jgi:dipeptidyl aminopeptidase/acylaminoacyl peptidase